MSVAFFLAALGTVIGVLVAGGIYLALRARTFQVVLGLTLISYAVNLFLFASGRLVLNRPPIWDKAAAGYTEPLPQALVLYIIFGVIQAGLPVLWHRLRKDGETLPEAALWMLRYSEKAKAFLKRKEKKYGKSRAMTMLARKIARAVYYMLKQKEPFDAVKFFAN